MPNTLVIPGGYLGSQIAWDSVPVGPSNVLVIPSQGANPAPPPPNVVLVAQPQKNTIRQYERYDLCGEMGGGDNACVIHDAVSGWWVEFLCKCDPNPEVPCGVGCIEGVLPCGASIDFDTGQFLLDTSNIPCSLIPDWARGGQPCQWDMFGVVCSNLVDFEVCRADDGSCADLGDGGMGTNPNWCLSPGVVVNTPTGQVCQYDPYIPLPFPREFARRSSLRGVFTGFFREKNPRRGFGGMGSVGLPAGPSFKVDTAALNVAARIPLPNRIVPIGCGCGTPDDYEETLDGN